MLALAKMCTHLLCHLLLGLIFYQKLNLRHTMLADTCTHLPLCHLLLSLHLQKRGVRDSLQCVNTTGQHNKLKQCVNGRGQQSDAKMVSISKNVGSATARSV